MGEPQFPLFGRFQGVGCWGGGNSESPAPTLSFPPLSLERKRCRRRPASTGLQREGGFAKIKPYGVKMSRACYRMVAFCSGDTMYFRRISDLRTDNDMTQRGVADYLNMNLEVYRRYEKGIREIPVWAVLKLAELYHTSTDYILGLTDDPAPRA